MNKFTFDGSWNQIKGKLQQQFGHLTDDDVQFIEGKGEELLGRLQSKLGMGANEVEHLLNRLKGEIPKYSRTASDTLGSLRRKAEVVKEMTSGVAVDMKSTPIEKTGDLQGQAAELYEKSAHNAQTLRLNAEKYIQEKPWQALATALGVGFIAGLVIRR